MNPMKRLGLVALLVVGVTLLASTAAAAGKVKGEDWGAIELTNTGEEAQASGEATLTNVVHLGFYPVDPDDPDGPAGWFVGFSGTLSVKCQNLTPGATYWTPAGTFTAGGRKGKGAATAEVILTIVWKFREGELPIVLEPYVVDVSRLNTDGSTTTVLTGDFVPPGL